MSVSTASVLRKVQKTGFPGNAMKKDAVYPEHHANWIQNARASASTENVSEIHQNAVTEKYLSNV